MAVVNQVTSVLAHPQTASQVTGSRTKRITKIITIAAADDDTSVYRIGELPDTAVVTSLNIYAADITSGTSFDVGLFDMAGVARAEACYAAAVDLSGHSGLAISKYASAYSHPAMTVITTANANKQVWEIAGDVEGPSGVAVSGSSFRIPKYILGLTANTIGSAAATIVVEVDYESAGG